MPVDAAAVLTRLAARAAETTDPHLLGKTLVDTLKQGLTQASWVGIYWLDGDELVLGPFVGPETEHVRIPVGKGICGTAILEDDDQRIPDVREVQNYLACSATTRSELVVLIRCMGKVVGQIDLDADSVDAFSQTDHSVVRAAADALGGILSLTRSGRFPR
jgi:L-methionine (R)-S-oxide reductase